MKKRLRRIDVLEEKKHFLTELNASQEKIAEVEEEIAKSKRASKAIRKGGSYESTIANKFHKEFPFLKLVRTKQSGGSHKEIQHEALRGDLANMSESDFPFHLELKNQKTWKPKEWWKQCTSDCIEGKIPLLIMHQEQVKEAISVEKKGKTAEVNKVTQSAEDFVMLSLKDFLQLIKTILKE